MRPRRPEFSSCHPHLRAEQGCLQLTLGQLLQGARLFFHLRPAMLCQAQLTQTDSRVQIVGTVAQDVVPELLRLVILA